MQTYGTASIKARDGNYIISAMTYSPSVSGIILLKCDSLGNFISTKGLFLQGNYEFATNNIIELPNGNLTLGGTEYLTQRGFIIRANSQFDTLSTQWLISPNGSGFTDFCETKDKGYLASGTYSNGPLGNQDLLLVKMDSLGYSGCSEGHIPFSTSGVTFKQIPTNIYISSNGGLLFSLTLNMQMGVQESVLCSSLGIEEHLNNSTDMNVFPNPTNGTFTIQSNLFESQNLQIFDINGKLVQSQVFYNETTADLSHLSEGLYAIRLTSIHGIVTKKLVLIK
ncbi:MAG TPA: T9SS type A sorting domain-containing protein, partial [Bacteroidia bacterium]|jgi:hypothetical protein|nr:T9SS type A sorting domain-containing protein [Bacteroidia bacterium]